LTARWFCSTASAVISYQTSEETYIETDLLLGGYRIESVIDTPNNGETIYKKYKYIKDDGSYSIHELKKPLFLDYKTSYSSCDPSYRNYNNLSSEYIAITSDNLGRLYSSNPNIFYESVVEEIDGNGKIIHYFDIKEDSPAIPIRGRVNSSTNSSNTGWSMGNELKTIYKNLENKTIKIVESNYIENNNKNSYLAAINRQKLYIPQADDGETWSNFKNLDIAYYKNYSRFTYLKSQKTTEYFENKEPIVTEVNYNYDSTNHLQLTKQTTTNSKGETLTTEYQYPPDWKDNSIAQRLTAENRIAEPLTVVQKNGSNNVISAIYNEYNDFNGILQKSRVFQKKGDDKFAEGDDVITFNSYDNKGNITQYTPKNGIPVSIIWGYNGQYPIAKIEGLAYSDLMNSANYTSNIINAIIYQTTVPNNRDFIANLLMQLRVNDFCKDAMVTGYIYKPLVGVAEIIQPNGQTEYYNYDDAGRLQEIKNDKGEVLKTFEYNYKP